MLAGNKSAALDSVVVQLHEILVDSLLELRFLQVVAALIDVQVSVACVAEALDDQTALLAVLLGEGQEGSDVVDRNDDVALIKELGLRFDGLQEAGTCCPRVLDLRRGICHENVQSALLQNQIAALLDEIHQGVFIFRVKGDQQVSACGDAFDDLREYGAADIALTGQDDLSLHELQSLRSEACLLDDRDGGDGALKILEGNHEADDLLRCRDDLQGELGDDAQGSFASDHQVQEAVAGACLGDCCAEAGDLAARKNDLHGQDVVAGGAVLHGAHAAGVGGDVAAHGSQLLARIRRIQIALSLAVVSQLLEKDAGLDGHGEVVEVIAQDLFHLGGVDQHAAEHRDASARQAGSCASGGHRDQVVVADLHDRCDLFRAGRHKKNVRAVLSVDRHFIVGVIFVDLFSRQDVTRSSLLQLFDDFRSQSIVCCHSFSSLLFFSGSTALPGIDNTVGIGNTVDIGNTVGIDNTVSRRSVRPE